LFLKYDFIVLYKPGRTHVVVDALLKLPYIIEPKGVFDQTIDVNLFYTEQKWLNDVKEFSKTKHIKGVLLIQ